MRSRLQLSLFDLPARQETSTPTAPAAAATTSTTTTTTTTTTRSTLSTPSTSPAVSKTKLLCDAIVGVLPGAKVLIVDTRSTLLSQTEKDGVRVVRVHQMFLDADEVVRRAVAVYLATGSRRAGAVVDDFVKVGAHLLNHTARPLKDGAAQGRVHDLGPIYAAVNERYFDGAIVAEIGWGLAGSPQRRARRSITFGSYDHRARRITLHPVLDAPHVPLLVVARIVHHEMLHAKIGEARSESGRRIVHSRQFRLEEATFDGAKEADRWLDQHLDELLRWRPR